ncbi:MAG: hypothetical protein ACWGPR_11840 [Candidatus Deferrimicrobiaceae bacterium]
MKRGKIREHNLLGKHRRDAAHTSVARRKRRAANALARQAQRKGEEPQEVVFADDIVRWRASAAEIDLDPDKYVAFRLREAESERRRAEIEAHKLRDRELTAPPHDYVAGARAVADAAIATANVIHQAMPGEDYAFVRLLTVRMIYEVLAWDRGMRVAPIVFSLPELHQYTGPQVCLGKTALPDLVLPPLRGLPSDLTPVDFGAAHETLSVHGIVDGEIARTTKRTTVHFTPEKLAWQVAERTLEPLFACLDENGGRTLDLRICDPAVGAGAFLVVTARQLAQRAVFRGEETEWWTALRLAAIRCCHGVDVCRFAVHSAKLALTLECRADMLADTWLDDNIRVGDALVGLSGEQIGRFDWQHSAPQVELGGDRFAPEVDAAVAKAVRARQARMASLEELVRDNTGPAARESETR